MCNWFQKSWPLLLIQVRNCSCIPLWSTLCLYPSFITSHFSSPCLSHYFGSSISSYSVHHTTSHSCPPKISHDLFARGGKKYSACLKDDSSSQATANSGGGRGAGSEEEEQTAHYIQTCNKEHTFPGSKKVILSDIVICILITSYINSNNT